MKKAMFLNITLCVLILAGSFCTCTNKLTTEEEGECPKYYYAFSERIHLCEADNKVVFAFDKEYYLKIQQYLQNNLQIVQMDFQIDNNYCILTTSENANVKALMKDLKKQAGVKSVNPMYLTFNGMEMGVTDEFIVQFKEHISKQKIDEMHKKFNVEVKKITELYMLLSVPINFDILEVANAYQTSGLVKYSHPNFIVKMIFH